MNVRDWIDWLFVKTYNPWTIEFDRYRHFKGGGEFDEEGNIINEWYEETEETDDLSSPFKEK